MIDIAILAGSTMKVLAPFLPLAANKMVEGFSSETGKKLHDWLVAKVKGTQAEASLARAVAEPENKRNQQRLQLDIEELAEKDPEFRDQLAKLLKEIAGESTSVDTTQVSNQVGDNNKNAQASGKDINIHIG